MATLRSASLAPTNSSDANFRLWINEIHNALIAFGWVQGSDTGQINFSTVTRPTAVNTYQGFAIYSMGDSFQTACPVYMRLDFGTASGTDSPGIKLTVGIGDTDGAGTLRGCVMQTVTMGSNSGGNATTTICRSAGTSGSFRMIFWGDQLTGNGFTICIERDQSSQGVDTAGGVNIIALYITSGGSTNYLTQFLSPNGELSPQSTTRLFAMLSETSNQGSSFAAGSQANYCTVGSIRTVLGQFRNPIKGLIIVSANDFPNQTFHPIVTYGVSRNYLIMRPNQNQNLPLNTWLAACFAGFLWE